MSNTQHIIHSLYFFYRQRKLNELQHFKSNYEYCGNVRQYFYCIVQMFYLIQIEICMWPLKWWTISFTIWKKRKFRFCVSNKVTFTAKEQLSIEQKQTKKNYWLTDLNATVTADKNWILWNLSVFQCGFFFLLRRSFFFGCSGTCDK